jgi:pantoate--beta-alanine ligase
LALSSRNKYLSPEERRQAAVLYQSLRQAKRSIAGGERNAAKIRERIRNLIKKQSLAILEYIAITDAHTLEPQKKLKGEILISLAARFGKARLIDNIQIKIN